MCVARRPPGIRESEQLRGLVERLARGIVERVAEQPVVPDPCDVEQLAVAATPAGILRRRRAGAFHRNRLNAVRFPAARVPQDRLWRWLRRLHGGSGDRCKLAVLFRARSAHGRRAGSRCRPRGRRVVALPARPPGERQRRVSWGPAGSSGRRRFLRRPPPTRTREPTAHPTGGESGPTS